MVQRCSLSERVVVKRPKAMLSGNSLFAALFYTLQSQIMAPTFTGASPSAWNVLTPLAA